MIPLPRLWPARALPRRAALRTLWLTLAALVAALTFAATPRLLAELQTICTGRLCMTGQIHINHLKRFPALGASVESYGLFATGLILCYVVVHLAVGAVILWRRPADPLAVMGALSLLLFGITTTSYSVIISEAGPLWWWLSFGAGLVSMQLVTLFFCLFPSGRFVPRWSVWLAPLGLILDLLAAVLMEVAPSRPLGRAISLSLNFWFITLALLQLYRYRYVSTPSERQQAKWIVYGVVVGYGGAALVDLGRQLVAVSPLAVVAPPAVVFWNIALVLKLAVPFAFGMAILRAGLYAVDEVVGRTMLYGALTTLLVAIYALVAGSIGALVQVSGSLLASLVAAGCVAVLFAPLHHWLQRGFNRLLYGQRDEPYAVVAQLSRQLAGALEPSAVLPTIVQTVQRALRLSYVGVVADKDGRTVAAAAVGRPIAGLLRLPLRYQGEALGELLLCPRGPGESWSPSDRRLLDDLCEHAGTAVHAVLLTLELQQARTRLISAREEERRRLRRDLHDGLGPTLASLTMQIDTARVLVRDDPDTGVELLAEVQGQLKETIGNVRRLVYALRPPALDQFGLVAAIREQLAREGRSDGPLIVVEAAPLPPLPAAVEVAAYYIVTEAATNVRRHARASRCVVRLSADEALRLEVRDDGIGLPERYEAGVGLQSMRERATELGGGCAVAAAPGGGTCVAAWLPLSHDLRI